MGKASAVESSVEKTSVEETRGVGGGVGVDATVDGAGVDRAQATVEEDLGLGLSFTLSMIVSAPPSPTAPRPSELHTSDPELPRRDPFNP